MSASLKANGFQDVSLIDLRELSSWREYSERLQSLKPDFIGVTSNSIDRQFVFEAVNIAKQVLPTAKVVVGGPDVVVAKSLYMDNNNIDHVVYGEGEISFLKLVKGEVAPKLVIGEKPDLDTLPFPDYDLFNLKNELALHMIPGMASPSMSITNSRGCPFKCTFCQPTESKLYGKVRVRGAERTVQEIKLLQSKYGIKSISFVDDCLLSYPKWVEDFSNCLIKNGVQLEWMILGRTNSVGLNERTLSLASKAGLYCVMFGVESGSDRVLEFLNKRTKVEDAYKANEICKRFGIKFWMNMIVGLPTETEEEMWMTKKLIEDLQPFHVAPNIYAPVPGTYLYDYCVSNDLVLPSSKFRRDLDAENIKGVNYTVARQVVDYALQFSGNRFYPARAHHSLVGKAKRLVRRFLHD